MSFEEIIDHLNWERSETVADLRDIDERQEALERDLQVATSELGRIDAELASARADFNTTVQNYAERVVLGVNFLNDNTKGWAKTDKISISDLDLADSQSCVLGQLAAKSALRSAGWNLTRPWEDDDNRSNFEFGDACRAFKAKDEDWDEYAHGFDWTNTAHVGAINGDNSVGYEILNHLWAEAIRLRRGKKKVTAEKLAKKVLI